MTVKEIRELMRLRDWSKTQLAANLDVTETSVASWLAGRRNPGGPAQILMRQMLAESRKPQKAAV